MTPERKACGCRLLTWTDDMGRRLLEPLPIHECCLRCCTHHEDAIRYVWSLRRPVP